MIKKLFTALYADKNMQILVMFCLIIIKWVYLTIINLTGMILVLLFMSDFWLGILNLKNAKYLEKELNEELISVAWHPNRWWDWCVSEDEKKEIDPMFIEEL